MMLGSLTGMDAPVQRRIRVRIQGDKIGIKNCGTEVPCSALNPKNLPENRHSQNYFLNSVYPHFPQAVLSLWSAIMTPGPQRGQYLFAVVTFAPSMLKNAPRAFPFGAFAFFSAMPYAAPSSLGLGIPRAIRCARSVFFLPSSFS